MFHLIIFCVFIAFCKTDEVLQEIFFDNLKVHPTLLADHNFSEKSKEFVDHQVENYRELIAKRKEFQPNRVKRSNLEGFEIDLIPFSQSHLENARKIIFFEQNHIWFAAFLKICRETDKLDELHIYKHSNYEFTKVTKIQVTDGFKLVAANQGNFTLIALAEHNQQIQIFEFTANERLKPLQNIQNSNLSDVNLWKTKEAIFLATSSGTITIYRWFGRHFDEIQRIASSNMANLTPFSIGSHDFLGVTNHQNLNENVKTYAAIFKYNLQTEQFAIYQGIVTKNCSKIDYFKVSTHDFLIFSNCQNNSIIFEFVEDYFVPFQKIEVQDEQIWTSIKYEGAFYFLVTSCTANKIRVYEYNNWNFAEKYSLSVKPTGSSKITSILSYATNDKPDLVLTYNNGVTAFYQIDFSTKENENQKMLSWCQTKLNEVETPKKVDFSKMVLRGAMRGDIDETDKTSQSNLNSENLIRNEQFEEILLQIETHAENLQKLNDSLNNLLQSPNAKRITTNLNASEVNLAANGFITNLKIRENLNEKNISALLDNVININNDVTLFPSVSFDSLSLSDFFMTQMINGHFIDSIVKTSDSLTFDKIIIDGDLHVEDGFQVGNLLQVSAFNAKNIILNGVEQSFDNVANFSGRLAVGNLETSFVNHEKLSAGVLENNIVDNLTSKYLFVHGFVNNVDMQTLNKYALRKTGSQIIEKEYTFDNLQANSMRIKSGQLSGHQMPEDFVFLEGNYNLAQDVRFSQDFNARNLTALSFLNSIPVSKGKLEILEKNSEALQQISAEKQIEYVDLWNPINLQGKIRSKAFDRINPIVINDQDLIISNDLSIWNNVRVEELVQSADVWDASSSSSLRKLADLGVKLTDPQVPNHLHFTKLISTDEVIVETLNQIDPSSWIVNGDVQTQIIQGWKQFRGNLKITGATNVFHVNNINVAELESGILKQDGNQVVTGSHFVKFVDAEERFTSKNVTFGEQDWKDVVTLDKEQIIAGTTTINNNIVAHALTTEKILVKQLINDVNFTELVEDVVFSNQTTSLAGLKSFQDLEIAHVRLDNNFENGDKFLMDKQKLQVYESLDFSEVQVENLHFSRSLNELDVSKFEATYLNESGLQNLLQQDEFEKITIFGRLQIDSNQINNVSLSSILNDTVKIDEPFHFAKAHFVDGISSKTINLDGQIEFLDLENIAQSNASSEQTLTGKTSLNHVQVEGALTLSQLENFESYRDLCKNQAEAAKIIVEGNVFFTKDARLNSINQIDVPTMRDFAWMRNEPQELTGVIQFHNITLHDDVNCDGFVNNANIKYIAKNYFSKSADQTIHSVLNLVDGAVFAKNVSAPEMTVQEVNDLDLRDEFINKIFLDNFDQLFEDGLYMEEFHVDSVDGNFEVNNLNLDSDVMRYDVNNVLVGRKVVKNLLSNNLNLNKDLRLQNLGNAADWLASVVLKTGSFSVQGKKSFQNAVVENSIGVENLFNNEQFGMDSILLRKSNQNISGKKIFRPLNRDAAIEFKSIKMKDAINDVDMIDFMHNQAYKNADNIFKSRINLYNNISTSNILIERQFEDMNIYKLIKNLDDLQALSSFTGKFEYLKNISKEIQHSLKGQDYPLKYYKEVATFQNVNKLLKIQNNGKDALLTFLFNSNSTLINMFILDNQQFKPTEFIAELPFYPNFVEKLTLSGKDYIYIEQKLETPEGLITHSGSLLEIIDNQKLEVVQEFPTFGTTFLTNLILPHTNQDCLVFLSIHKLEMHIMCKKIGTNSFEFHQNLASPGATKLSVIQIDEVPFIAAINEVTNIPESNSVYIWMFNSSSFKFDLNNVLMEGEPISVTSIGYYNEYYLAIAFANNTKNPNTRRTGVEITRFDRKTGTFEPWLLIGQQHTKTDSEIEVQFAILPSDELVLYTLTKNMAVFVYSFRGLSGFVEQHSILDSNGTVDLNCFALDKQHFISIKRNDEIRLVQAVFN